jgi:hypothetical protein
MHAIDVANDDLDQQVKLSGTHDSGSWPCEVAAKLRHPRREPSLGASSKDAATLH